MELLFVFALLLIILYYFYKKKPKNHYPVIQYQDHKKHVLNYKKIQTMNTPIKDLQYVYYLLSLIDELPQDKSILIYLLLKKWNEQKDISLEEKDYELSIHFLKTYKMCIRDRYGILYLQVGEQLHQNEKVRIGGSLSLIHIYHNISLFLMPFLECNMDGVLLD